MALQTFLSEKVTDSVHPSCLWALWRSKYKPHATDCANRVIASKAALGTYQEGLALPHSLRRSAGGSSRAALSLNRAAQTTQCSGLDNGSMALCNSPCGFRTLIIRLHIHLVHQDHHRRSTWELFYGGAEAAAESALSVIKRMQTALCVLLSLRLFILYLSIYNIYTYNLYNCITHWNLA